MFESYGVVNEMANKNVETLNYNLCCNSFARDYFLFFDCFGCHEALTRSVFKLNWFRNE